MIGWSLWSQLKTRGLRMRLRFYSSTQMELSKKNLVHLKALVFLLEFQNGIQRKLESQKKRKKRNLRKEVSTAQTKKN